MRIPIKNDEHWRELRASHIGGSEVAALFGESSYMTHFELWVMKSGKVTPAFPDNDRIFWGNVLESAIGKGTAMKTGWQVEKCKDYHESDNNKRLGCTPDFLITDKNGRKGLLQTKNTDRLQFMQWEDEQPPMAYLLQLQHELACTGLSWGVLGVLVGGNDLKLYQYDAHVKVITKLEKAVTAFWQSVEEGKEPTAFADDYEMIRLVYNRADDEIIDLTSDNHLPELCRIALEAAERRKEAERQEKDAKSRIMQKIQNCGRALVTGFNVKKTVVNKAAYTVNPQSYPQLTIKREKETSI